MKKRRIVIILGSRSDLKQCLKGLLWLQEQVDLGNIVFDIVYVRSQHRHTEQLQWLLNSFQLAEGDAAVDVIIAGAGWAAVLPGCIDAYLRYHLQNTSIRVIGVAFWAGLVKTLAAILSITQVPGTQVRYARWWGSRAFLNACKMAVEQPLWKIQAKSAPSTEDLNLERAIELASQQ